MEREWASEWSATVRQSYCRRATPIIALSVGIKVWLVAGATDMRKGFDRLAAFVQAQLSKDPYSG